MYSIVHECVQGSGWTARGPTRRVAGALHQRGGFLEASPLPPAPLVTSWLMNCRLKGLAGFALKLREHCLEYIFLATVLVIGHCWFLSSFKVLGSPFWLTSEVLGTILVPFWWSSGTQMHSKEHWKVPGWILDYFDGFWVPPSDTILDRFLRFSVIWIVKKYVWIVGMTFIDCWMENLLISDVPTYEFIW